MGRREVAALLLAAAALAAAGEPARPGSGNGSLGVLILYMDPGMDLARAERVLEAAADLGAGWIRVGLVWELANPGPGEYDFETLDWVVDRARERGLAVLPVVMFTPRWASSRPESGEYYLFPPTRERVGDLETPLGTVGTGYDYLYEFARVAASRYRGVITHWELWNEPDMAGSLRDPDGDGSTADEYAEMLAYFYRGVKDGDPGAEVVLGGLADDPREPDCDPDYLEELLADRDNPAADHFDVHNIHANFRDPDDIAGQIERNRRILERYGAGDRAVWITEVSYTPVERFQILPDYRGGEEGFNRYVRDALRAGIEGGAEVVFWAPLHDYPPDTPEDYPYKYSGLYTYDLRVKDAGRVFREVADGLRGRDEGSAPPPGGRGLRFPLAGTALLSASPPRPGRRRGVRWF